MIPSNTMIEFRGRFLRSGAPGTTLVVFFYLAMAGLHGNAHAQNKIEPWLVSGGRRVAVGAGLNMKVDTRWTMRGGYRPVRITFTRTAAAKTDRVLTVELIVLCEMMNENDRLVVSEDFTIPAASTRLSKVVSVPEIFYDHNVVVNVFEDELKVKPLSDIAFNRGMNFSFLDCGVSDGLTPAILFVGDSIPDTSQLCLPFEPVDDEILEMGMGMGMGMNPAQPPAPVQTPKKPCKIPLPTALALPSSELPPRWIDYSGLDVVCLSLEQLRDLKKKRPEVFGSIVVWTSAGGNLWVYGVGTKWNHLPELERMLGIPESENKTQPVGLWTRPDVKRFGLDRKSNVEMPKEAVDSNMGRSSIWDTTWDDADPELVKSPDAPKPPESPHFVYRDIDMGMVVAIGSENPFPGTRWQWLWLLDACGPSRWNWEMRHAVSPGGGNNFFDFQIPGVGLVPVSAFRVILTMFVIAIGPMNYLLLRHLRRLSLLAVTIPVGAILVTAGLFVYAAVADGLDTRVRARSFTIIDQHSGRAVCWSRMCYYAGISPSQGLKFPADVAVIPIEQPVYYENRDSRELVWDDEQWMSRGWLDARTLTQYLTLRSRRSTAGLEIAASPNSENEVEVKNNLGTNIERVALRMGDGKYYWASDVGENTTCAATEVAVEQVVEWLRKSNSDNQLRFSDGISGDSLVYNFYAYNTSNCNRMEHKLNTLGLWQPEQKKEPLAPCSYVAVVARSPEVVVGIDDFQEKGSFHVVFGRWREEAGK